MWVNVDMGDTSAVWIAMDGNWWSDVFHPCIVFAVLFQWSTDRSDCPHGFMTEPPHARVSGVATVL